LASGQKQKRYGPEEICYWFAVTPFSEIAWSRGWIEGVGTGVRTASRNGAITEEFYTSPLNSGESRGYVMHPTPADSYIK